VQENETDTAKPMEDFPVDEDQPLAFLYGDWDDSYFEKIKPLAGDTPQKLRDGVSTDDIDNDFLESWPL
jgi:hypothetical protein